MKVVIFGDVHGNIVALEKLFEIEQSETDTFVCHGDVVNYGPWTNECVQFLQTVPNCILLKGNHEHYFIDGVYDGKNIIAQTFYKHCYENFNPSLVNVISGYQDKFDLQDFTIQHTIGNQYIFKDTDISNIAIDTNFIIGHSHQQFHLKKDGFDIYNTGSIGQNREHINLSCYLKYDTDTHKMELKNFVHDIDKVINQMRVESYPQLCIDYYLSKKRF
jgi:predicted phosphodiesterase